MTFKIEYTGKLSSRDGVKCLGYGGSGFGKTRLCATAPRPFVFSAEKGLLSLRQNNIPYAQINNIKDLIDAHDWATKSAESKKFDTICLDSVSEIAEQALSAESAKTKDPRKLYPAYQSTMMDILRDFRDMPQKHIYFIAKETRLTGPDNTIKAGPSFPGNKLPEAAPYFFDQVFQIVNWRDPATGVVSTALKCRGDNTSEGKDRSGMLELWEPFDLSAMFRKIMAV